MKTIIQIVNQSEGLIYDCILKSHTTREDVKRADKINHIYRQYIQNVDNLLLNHGYNRAKMSANELYKINNTPFEKTIYQYGNKVIV